jgi:hypothetical protein
MEKIGIDVHKVATQVCVLTETGDDSVAIGCARKRQRKLRIRLWQLAVGPTSLSRKSPHALGSRSGTMESIWLAFCPGTASTRVVVMRGPNELILKAQLRLSPSSPRAVSALLEALALWEGVKVRAAFVVDKASARGQSSLHQDTFAL